VIKKGRRKDESGRGIITDEGWRLKKESRENSRKEIDGIATVVCKKNRRRV